MFTVELYMDEIYNIGNFKGDFMQYKYYKELDNKDNFKIYLRKDNVKRDRTMLRKISLEFIKNNQELFKKISWLDKFIVAHNKVLGIPLFMDGNKRWTLYEIFYYLEDLKNSQEECGLEEINLITNSSELIRKLNEYEVYCNYFCSLYPERQELFLNIKKDIDKAYKEIWGIIKISPLPRIVEETILDGWYFTKSGYLYNPNGKVGDDIKGHKEGNLKYSFDKIERSLKNNKDIQEPLYLSKESYKEHLKKLINDGCVNELDFQIYSNMIYDFNSVLTGKFLRKMEFYEKIVNLPDKELKKLILPKGKKMIERKFTDREKLIQTIKSPKEMKESYQPNINTLVQGYFAAVIDLYEAFGKLNNSSKPYEMYKKIWELCQSDYNDILIRFCGFSKVERCEKKITTASPYGIELFKEYLEKGFILYIIPEIVYSEVLDDIRPDSYIVIRYLEEQLKRYEGKGRILIRGINC